MVDRAIREAHWMYIQRRQDRLRDAVMHQGIEGGLKHKKPIKGSGDVTADPYHAYLDDLEEQRTPGYRQARRRARKAAALEARARQAQDAEREAQLEAEGRAQLAQLGLTF